MAQPKVANFTLGMKAPYQADLEALAQQQNLLQQQLADEQGGTDGKLINTGHFFVPDLSGLGNALASRRTKEALENNRKKAADYQGKYQESLVGELKRYGKEKDGGDVELPGPTEDGGALTGKMPGNQRAFESRLNSPYPEVRALAAAEKASYDKRFEKLLERSSFTSAQGAGDNIDKLAPKSEYKEANGTFFDTTDGKTPSPVPSLAVTQQTLADGTIVNQYPGGKQDTVDKATKINLPGQSLIAEKIKGLEADQKGAAALAATVRSTEQALDALRQGAQAGYGQDFIQNARTLVSSLTGAKFDASTPTAVLAKTLAENVVNEFGGKLGSGVSNADVQFMQAAQGGLATDPKAIERILAIRAAAAINKIRSHNETVDTLATEAERAPATSRQIGGDTVRKLYGVPLPPINFAFPSPDAQASFEAGFSGKSLDQARSNMAADAKTPAFKAATGKTSTSMTPEQRKQRLRDLGLNPID